jgi:hypothetical protein
MIKYKDMAINDFQAEPHNFLIRMNCRTMLAGIMTIAEK